MLVIMSIELEAPDNGEILCVHLRGMSWQVGYVNHLGDQVHGSNSQMDGLAGQADASRVQTDAPRVLNNAKTDVMDHRDSADTYLGAGGTKHDRDDTNGVRSKVDVLSGHSDMPCIEMDVSIAANIRRNVRTLQVSQKT